MSYGPNTTTYLDRNPASQGILEYVKQYAPEILQLFEIGLDSKYFYADPIVKAKSIPYIIANTQTNLREMPEVDIPNLEKGLGGECLSITLMTCTETAQRYGQEVLQSVERHSGHESKQFTPESKRIHNFLSINARGKKIIFDPACKQIQWHDDGYYTIKKTLPILEDINYHKNRILYSHIGDGTLDYAQCTMKYKSCTIHILGYITDTPVLLGLGICKINNSYIVPMITIYNEHGKEQGRYFYDEHDRCVSNIDESIAQYGHTIHHTIISILKDFKQRKVLQIK